MVTWVFEYLLAVLAKQHGIQVHAYVVMSNHYHLVVTDARGCLPDFMRNFNSMLARSINAFRGRWDAFWERKSFSGVRLIADQDVLASMAYTLANPVKARLVNRARQWEGATSAGMPFERPRPIVRPPRFFSAAMPEQVEFELTRPACFANLTNEELRTSLEADVARRESASHRDDPRSLGMARVMKQRWNASPSTFEETRGLQPTIKAADKWARIEALQQAKEWLGAYRAALARFIAGSRDVEFPVGTWWMCARLGCRVALE